MRFFTKKKVIVTHDGVFHADDLFACATLSLYFKKHSQSFKIIRTRDEKKIQSADVVCDVGGIYDDSHNRFDHHQKQGAGTRVNGIPYASFGLVWKHYGKELCNDSEEVWQRIDKKIAASLDAIDNGVDVVTPIFDTTFPYTGEQVFLINMPTWKEDRKNIDQIFSAQVKRARTLLAREIKVALDDNEARQMIKKMYEVSSDKRIVILDRAFPRYLFQSVLSTLSEPIYVLYPSSDSSHWKIEAITKSPSTFESRKLFPQSWRGFFEGDPKFKEVTGVPDAIFSHRTGFYMTAVSKEGALMLAQKALVA
jgi:uncharacterized UPF0160 family protein